MRGLQSVEDVARVLPHLAIGRLDRWEVVQSGPSLDFSDVGQHLTHPEVPLREGRSDLTGEVRHVGAVEDVGAGLGQWELLSSIQGGAGGLEPKST